VESKRENKIVVIRPHLFDCLFQKFKKETIGKRIYKTPGTPRFKIQRPTKDVQVLVEDLQKKYRSGVGMLFYLTKYSRPDIINVLRELSKCMDGTTWFDYHEMLLIITLVIDTKILDWKLNRKLKMKWNGVKKIFYGSDLTGDPDTRISITGFIVYLLDILIYWRSKAQSSVTLSRNKAEYIANSESAKDINLIYYLLEDFHVEAIFPIVVKTDNVGAIFHTQKCIDWRSNEACGHFLSLHPRIYRKWFN
jgi:hypothetical protein